MARARLAILDHRALGVRGRERRAGKIANGGTPMQYTFVLEQEPERGCIICTPALPDCVGEGDTEANPQLPRTPPDAVKRDVQFHKALMPRDPFPRFRLGPEATHCGRIGAGYCDFNAEGPTFQRNGTVGCLSVRVCHSHANQYGMPRADRKAGVKWS
jgi:hypothetical protein